MRIAVIGVGYVGLPLAVELSRQHSVTAFDVNKQRIMNLSDGYDSNDEVPREQILSQNLVFTWDPFDLNDVDVFVVTVPTPVKADKTPDLALLESACDLIAPCLKNGSFVFFESTVFPGATRNVAMPRLLGGSGYDVMTDADPSSGIGFGFSPERLAPGGGKSIREIVKVVSGNCETSIRTAQTVYSCVSDHPLHIAKSIETAEAAKVFENVQRDVNVALVNELSHIAEALGLHVHHILETARTKWNFIDFTPGLVGGHCIGIDPYYLLHIAHKNNIFPNLISQARKINEQEATRQAWRIAKLVENRSPSAESNIRILIYGAAFKPNCRDTRNSKVFDLASCLREWKFDVDIYDPLVDDDQSVVLRDVPDRQYVAIVYAVNHDIFHDTLESHSLMRIREQCLTIDLTDRFASSDVDLKF